ncbi:MAG: 30S ribosome-binding factor RbfA [Clostridiales Family XIII bacterium]|jgi:phosphoesterase RecJ-like protein|nr:30S ribosome-binding factor RbfA [Clostridiales Family XIII bacterium]
MRSGKHHFRGGRIGEEIKRIISDMLLRDLKDPRFSGLVSVSAVRASDDGAFATVYVTMLGSGQGEASDAEKQGTLDAFEKAKGLIRHEIGKKLGIRHTPDLRFKFDTSEEYGRHIEKLIDELGIERTPRERPMNTMDEIVGALGDADTVRVFPHENMDGDALGSAVALCLALRAEGKDCSVVINEKIPDNIAFIEYECTLRVRNDGACGGSLDIPDADAPDADAESDGADAVYSDYDLAVLMDVGETARLNGREGLFANGYRKMCIDHHVSSKPIYDYNFIDTSAAAVGEVVYGVIGAMGSRMDSRIANALYVGIVTDTGRFQYSNTTAHTMRVAADLIDSGVNPNDVSTEVYQNVRPEKLMLENAVMATMEMAADGRAAIVYMTRDMLADTGALDEETEGIAEKLRSIRGVEVAVFVRETEDGHTKGSMRSKYYFDIAGFASRFGGGGHARAAGFTSNDPVTKVVEDVKNAIEETL